mgnify:CR=1 FL=1
MPSAVASELFWSDSNEPKLSLTASKRGPEVGTAPPPALWGARFSQKSDWGQANRVSALQRRAASERRVRG